VPSRITGLGIPIRGTLLPVQIGHKRFAFLLTRRGTEDGLILLAVLLGAWVLGHKWEERALAGGKSWNDQADGEKYVF
jgi:hypothetical protein